MKRLVSKMRANPNLYGWLVYLIPIALLVYLGKINFHLTHMNAFLLLVVAICSALVAVLMFWYRRKES